MYTFMGMCEYMCICEYNPSHKLVCQKNSNTFSALLHENKVQTFLKV